jgi:hypothetical protein
MGSRINTGSTGTVTDFDHFDFHTGGSIGLDDFIEHILHGLQAQKAV